LSIHPDGIDFTYASLRRRKSKIWTSTTSARSPYAPFTHLEHNIANTSCLPAGDLDDDTDAGPEQQVNHDAHDSSSGTRPSSHRGNSTTRAQTGSRDPDVHQVEPRARIAQAREQFGANRVHPKAPSQDHESSGIRGIEAKQFTVPYGLQMHVSVSELCFYFGNSPCIRRKPQLDTPKLHIF
ncbi:hypothetical protein AC579_5302, partial [Pseudocercospora musae]